MKGSVFYALLLAPIVAITVWFYTLTRWGDVATFYEVAFIDIVVLASPILALRRRDRLILRYCSPLTVASPLAQEAGMLAEMMGLKNVEVLLADPLRLRRVNALQIGVMKPKIVISDNLIHVLLPEEQKAVLAHELAHSKRRHLLKRTVSGYSYFLAGLDLPVFSGYRYIPLAWTTALIQVGVVLFAVGMFLIVPYLGSEFEMEADSVAARITGSGNSLASALMKIANLNPARQSIAGFSRWTHNSLTERIRRLLQ